MKTAIKRKLNAREIATILHALRTLQSGRCVMCEHFTDAEMLTDVEIDGLCESLNFDGLRFAGRN